MKKFLTYLIILSFSSCTENNSKDNTINTDVWMKENKLTDKEAILDDSKLCNIFVDLKQWQITEDVANAMQKNLDCPTCTADQNMGTIDIYRQRVLLKLECKGYNVYPIGARYRKEDVERYCNLRGLEQKSEEGNVENYTTTIYMAEDYDGNKTYYDFVSICPPPKGCRPPDSSKNHTPTIKINLPIK